MRFLFMFAIFLSSFFILPTDVFSKESKPASLSVDKQVEKEVKIEVKEKVSKKEEKKRSKFYEIYLKKGELDASYLRKKVFLMFSPEDLNLALRDIRHFLRAVVRGILKSDDPNVKSLMDESFLINILNIHGHIIRFIEAAWVNKKTKKLLYDRKATMVPGHIKLSEYWKELEEKDGVELHCYKFYASCIDYLVVLLRCYFSFFASDPRHIDEVDSRWMYWLDGRLMTKLDGNLTFGGYYNEQIGWFKEVFAKWKCKFEKKDTLLETKRREMHNAYSG